MWDHAIWHADRYSEDEQLLVRLFLRKDKKYEHCGRLNIKIHILLFYRDNSRTIELRQMKFCLVNDYGHT
jgi:hypothetical protein